MSEEVVHMPIVVRPEDIDLLKSKREREILHKVGFKEGEQIGIEKGKQIGLEGGLLISVQGIVLTFIKGKLGYLLEEMEGRIKGTKDRDFVHTLVEKLVVSNKPLKALKEELYMGL